VALGADHSDWLRKELPRAFSDKAVHASDIRSIRGFLPHTEIESQAELSFLIHDLCRADQSSKVVSK
jgi:hypothetical protein